MSCAFSCTAVTTDGGARRRAALGSDGDLSPERLAELRARYRLGERPTIVCVSRLVPRKGQDMLIRALPAIRERVDGAALVALCAPGLGYLTGATIPFPFTETSGETTRDFHLVEMRKTLG